MKPGPRTRNQLARLARTWKQGEHVLISGATGSGKTVLARHIDQIRISNGGFVVVFVNKLTDDPTLLRDYPQSLGWVRWERMKKTAAPHENMVLLWPNTDKEKTLQDKLALQRKVFSEAMDILSRVGKWAVHIDEGLYFCSPQFLNLAGDLAILHAMGRSAGLSIVTLMQRPSNVPLIIYGSASNAFIGRSRERSDLQRLSELGGKTSAKELEVRIASQGRHDFLWIPVSTDGNPETVNLSR